MVMSVINTDTAGFVSAMLYLSSSSIWLTGTTQQRNNTTTQQRNNTTTQQRNNTTTQQHNNATTQQRNYKGNNLTECLNIHTFIV